MAKAKTPESIASLTFDNCEVGYIYSLTDPLTKEIRYIGQTVSPKDRLKSHICNARNEKNRKSSWVRSLSKRSEKPVMTVLYCVSLKNLDEQETYYINLFRKNHKLLNDCDGPQAEKYYTNKAKSKKELRETGCIGIKQKRNLWEVYLNLDKQRYYCGAFTNKVVAQRVYDCVARNYLPDYRLVTNFNGVSKFTVEQAQQLSKKLAKKRNNLTEHAGLYYLKDKNKYLVTIKKGNQRIKLGYTPDLQEALKIRDGVAKYYKKEDFELIYPDAEPLTISQAKGKLNKKTVKYTGVSFRKKDNKFYTTITIEGKNHFVGLFTDLNQAVKWYDRIAGYYNKKTNFTPDFTCSLEKAKVKIKEEKREKQ